MLFCFFKRPHSFNFLGLLNNESLDFQDKTKSLSFNINTKKISRCPETKTLFSTTLKIRFTQRIINAWNSFPSYNINSKFILSFKVNLDRYWIKQLINYECDITGTENRTMWSNWFTLWMYWLFLWRQGVGNVWFLSHSVHIISVPKSMCSVYTRLREYMRPVW